MSPARQFDLGDGRFVEEGVQLIKLAMCQRISLVRVTLRAAGRQPKEHRAGGVHAIDNRFVSNTRIEHRVAVKPRRDALINRCVG